MYVQAGVILAVYLHITLHRYFTVMQGLLPDCSMAHLGNFGIHKPYGIFTDVTRSVEHLGEVCSITFLCGVCSLSHGKYGGDSGQEPLWRDPGDLRRQFYHNVLLLLFALKKVEYSITTHHSSSSSPGTGTSSPTPGQRQLGFLRGNTRGKSKEVHVKLVSRHGFPGVLLCPLFISPLVSSLCHCVMLQALAASLTHIHALTHPIICVSGDQQLCHHLVQFIRVSQCKRHSDVTTCLDCSYLEFTTVYHVNLTRSFNSSMHLLLSRNVIITIRLFVRYFLKQHQKSF